MYRINFSAGSRNAYTHAERRENPGDSYRPYFFDNTNIVSVVLPTTTSRLSLRLARSGSI